MHKGLIFTFVGGATIAACGGDESVDSVRDVAQFKAAVTVSGPCEPGLDYAGRCDSSLLVWCEGGQQHEADCALQGETCGWESDAIGYNCVAPSTGGGACGSVDYAGYCDGETLVWCEDGGLREVDCSDSGRTCGYQSEAIGHNCLGGQSGGGGTSGLLTVEQIVDGYPYSMTQDYGYTSFDGGYSYCYSYGSWDGSLVHCGVDIGIPRGTALHAPGSGTITSAGGTPWYQDAYNYYAGDLRIQLDNGAIVLLGHSSEIYYGSGATVSKGTVVGASGTQNGDHLHLEVRVPDSSCSSGYCTVDPMGYFGW